MKKIVRSKTMIAFFLLISFTSCEDEETPGLPVQTLKPVADFEVVANRFRAGERIEFKDNSSDEDGFLTSWNWDFGNGDSSTEQSPTYFYPEGGDFTVSLTVFDNTGSASLIKSQGVMIEESVSGNPPTELWNFVLSGKLDRSSPAVSDDGTVFIGFNQENRDNQGPDFIAIKDGTQIWDQVFIEGSQERSDEVRSSPAITSDGSVYTASYFSRTVFKLNPSDGNIDAEINIDTRIRNSCPIFSADESTLYVGGHSRGPRGFHSVNSSLTISNWIFQEGEDFNATPAVGIDGTLFIPSTNGFVYAVNPDGSEKWSAMHGSWTATAIAIGEDGTVFLAAEDGFEGVLIAYNPDNGTEKWRKVFTPGPDEETGTTFKINHGGPAIAPDGTIYIGGHEQKLIAYNPDGTEKWSFEANGPIETVPAIDNEGNIYFGDTAGFFHSVSPEGEKIRQSLQLGDEILASAAIGSDGTIYVAANDGDFGVVYAFQTDASSLAEGGWPMYAKDARHTARR